MVFAIHGYELALGTHVSPPSWTPPPPRHLRAHPVFPGCHRAPSLGALLHTSELPWSSILHMTTYKFQCYSLKSSHPLLRPLSPKVCSLHLPLLCCKYNLKTNKWLVGPPKKRACSPKILGFCPRHSHPVSCPSSGSTWEIIHHFTTPAWLPQVPRLPPFAKGDLTTLYSPNSLHLCPLPTTIGVALWGHLLYPWCPIEDLPPKKAPSKCLLNE